MYKNFNLTESEKEQILNLHKEKGYKKPINEESYGDAGNYEMNSLAADRYHDEYSDYMDKLSPEQQDAYKQLEQYEEEFKQLVQKMIQVGSTLNMYDSLGDFTDFIMEKIPQSFNLNTIPHEWSKNGYQIKASSPEHSKHSDYLNHFNNR
jgi:hypothetical protein